MGLVAGSVSFHARVGGRLEPTGATTPLCSRRTAFITPESQSPRTVLLWIKNAQWQPSVLRCTTQSTNPRRPIGGPCGHFKIVVTTCATCCNTKQGRQCTYNFTMRRVRVTLFVLEKLLFLHIMSVCLYYCLSYLTRKAHLFCTQPSIERFRGSKVAGV